MGSTSSPGGNQVDGLPPVVNNETDQTARPMAKRLSVIFDMFFVCFVDVSIVVSNSVTFKLFFVY